MADPLFLRDADWTRWALCARESRRDCGVHRGRKARNDADHGPAAPTTAPGAAFARHIDHLEQLILHLGLHPDLWRQDAAPAGLDRVYGDPDRWLDPGDRLPVRRPLVGQDAAPPATHGDYLLAVRVDLLPGLLSDGRLAVAGSLRHRRRVAPIAQGGLQRRPPIALIRAVPSGNTGDRRVAELQHRGVDLRRPRSAGGNIANCRYRRQPIAELLPDLHCAAQPRCADGDPESQPPRGWSPRAHRRASGALRDSRGLVDTFCWIDGNFSASIS